MKRYVSIIIGSLLIGLSFNIFFVPYDIFPSGIIGLGAIFNCIYHINAAIFIAICNIIFLLIVLPISGKKETYKYLLPSILIPATIYFSRDICYYIYLDNVEKIIVALFGAIVTGYGYSLIYQVGGNVGGFEIFKDLLNNKSKIATNIIEIIIIGLAFLLFNIESAIYSAIAIFVIIYMSTKTKLGISSNKSFFIVTNKEEEIKNYLVNELKYDYTEFNVRGGYTNRKSKIIMSVIDTNDYYKLKEGISLIDTNAFISIIDNYETINKNVTLTSSTRDSLQKHE